MTEPLAYGVAEAAVALSVSKATIWRMIAAKELRTVKLGSRTLIRAEVLRAHLDRLETSPNLPSADAA